jgi:hypothetical protein
MVTLESGVQPPLSAMRSTVLISLRAALREMGHFEAYAAKLNPQAATMLERAIAGTWVPVECALDHYDACDALGLGVAEEAAIGSVAAGRILNALVGTALRLAAAAGSTPWGFLEKADRFWKRAYEGSQLKIDQSGPKDAWVTVIDNCVHQHSAFARHSFCGFAAAMMKPLCTRFFMRVDAMVDTEPRPWVRYLARWA